MLATLHPLVIAAAEVSHEFVPADDWRTIIALPAAIIIFFGSIYLLLRSNLGTRRAYLVLASSFFGFMVVISLFWTFGAPGTPIATGPQNLPGQALNYYQPQWFPFASDSEIAQDRYPMVNSFPEGFSVVDGSDEELVDLTQPLPDELFAFFSEERAGVPGSVFDGWEPTGDPQVATAADGTLLAALTFAPAEGGDDSFTAFAFYDPGFIQLPSLIMVGISLAGFILHVLLLGWDENRRREEEQALTEEEDLQPERVPARA